MTNESTLAEGVDPGVLPDKPLQNKEKDLLSQYHPMLQKLLHEKPDLQLTAIYAMQVHCHNNSFPKGKVVISSKEVNIEILISPYLVANCMEVNCNMHSVNDMFVTFLMVRNAVATVHVHVRFGSY